MTPTEDKQDSAVLGAAYSLLAVAVVRNAMQDALATVRHYDISEELLVVLINQAAHSPGLGPWLDWLGLPPSTLAQKLRKNLEKHSTPVVNARILFHRGP